MMAPASQSEIACIHERIDVLSNKIDGMNEKLTRY